MAIDLQKRAESVKINLEKKSIGNVTANVCLMVDISGSMSDMFAKGIVQETIDRIYAVAFNMDPDKILDIFVFNTGSRQLSKMVESHYGNFVNTVLLKETRIGGGTNYAPVINEVTDFYKPKKSGGFFGIGGTTEEKGEPIYAILITDGSNNDPAEARAAFARTASGNVYFQCVGISNPNEFRFIEKMGDEFDHVGFMNLNKLNISDDELYDRLINDEFSGWITAHNSK